MTLFRLFKITSPLTFVISVAAICSVPCSANVVYSTLTSGTALNSGGPDIVGTTAATDLRLSQSQDYAVFFSPTQAYSLTAAVVGVSYPAGQPGFTSIAGSTFNADFNVWIYSDVRSTTVVNGNPFNTIVQHALGTAIAEIGVDLKAPASPTLVTADAISSPVTLQAGTGYWIVLTPAKAITDIVWNEDCFGQAVQIDGTPWCAPVPEPASIGALALGLTLCFALKNRVRK